jgi:hypothetical protein
MEIADVRRHDENSYMIRFRCPWCKENSSCMTHSLVHRGVESKHSSVTHPFAMLVVCEGPRCRQPSMICGIYIGDLRDAKHFNVDTVYPNDRTSYQQPGVPERIAKTFEEALNCQAANLPYGAAVVGRRTLQIALMDKGASGTNLVEQIKQMPDDVLPGTFKKVAHQVRLIGNEAAHVDELTGTDTERLLKFVEQVLHQLYVLPHELEQAQQERPLAPQHRHQRRKAAARGKASVP